MKYFTIFLIGIVLVAFLSCAGPEDTEQLHAKTIMQTYRKEDRSLNLENKDFKNSVNLNSLNGETEIVNIFLSDNDIQRLDVSEYPALRRLIVSNNDIRFLSDLDLPTSIEHLDLSYNKLDSLKGIQKFPNLITLSVGHNSLEDDDFGVLKEMKHLRFVDLVGNPVSGELQEKMEAFNFSYTSRIK